MIFIDRTRVAEPDVLKQRPGSLADREYRKARRHGENDPFARQEGRTFTAFRHPTVKKALLDLFHGKCAYCETKIDLHGPFHIDQFRPKNGVVLADQAMLPQHYWWLANDWRNLYAACQACNLAKGSRFPLENEKHRADIEQPWETLGSEFPLLLDPCQPDVAGCLVFLDNGMVVSDVPRGQATIETIQLNRKGLVEERGRFARQIQNMFYLLDRIGEDRQPEDVLHEIVAMARPDAPYSAACGQLIRHGFAERGVDAAALLGDASTAPTSARRADAKAAQTKFKQSFEDYSLEEKRDVEKYLGTSRLIERIHIQNLGPIGTLTLDVAQATERAPWLMLLGENATGKSTVLKAVALALVGDKYLQKLAQSDLVDLGGMVREGADHGVVSVQLAGMSEPRRVRISRDGTIAPSGRSAQNLVLAYGSTRLLPRRPDHAHYGEDYARVENLFDPFLPLADAEDWLLGTTQDRFEDVARGLREMLDVGVGRYFRRVDGGVHLLERKAELPLNRLCDGYQTVLALFIDILSLVTEVWQTPEHAEGIVLLDEVGNHLHPAWKLEFVERMRRFLPRIQVIATSHEPLCLRGLEDGEIALLRRGPRGGVHLVEDLPSIKGMRVDQILTSEHFGLGSTLDPELNEKFATYQRLLRRRARTPAQEAEMRALQRDINHAMAIGQDERERLLLEAIDQFIAERGVEISQEQRAKRSDALNARLRRIWQETVPAEPAGDRAHD